MDMGDMPVRRAGGGRAGRAKGRGKGVAVAAGCKGAGKDRPTGAAAQGARRGGRGAVAGAETFDDGEYTVLGGADQDFSMSESEGEEQDEGDLRVGMDEQALGSGICSICAVTDGSTVTALGALNISSCGVVPNLVSLFM